MYNDYGAMCLSTSGGGQVAADGQIDISVSDTYFNFGALSSSNIIRNPNSGTVIVTLTTSDGQAKSIPVNASFARH